MCADSVNVLSIPRGVVCKSLWSAHIIDSKCECRASIVGEAVLSRLFPASVTARQSRMSSSEAHAHHHGGCAKECKKSKESCCEGACTDECKKTPCNCGDNCKCSDGCRCQSCSAPCKCDGTCQCGKGCTGADSCKCDRKCSCK